MSPRPFTLLVTVLPPRACLALLGLLAFCSPLPAQITISWNNGDLLTVLNPPTVNAGDILNVATTSNHDLRYETLTNNGTINWTSGYLRGGDGSVILNASGGTFNDQNAGGYTAHNPYGSGTFIFTNQGSYVRNVTGTTYYDIPFNNSGTVTLSQGDLQFRAGGTLASSGSISAASGTNVWFTSGYTIESASSLSGAGSFRLTGGTLTANGTVNVGNFLQTGGTLAGTQTLGSGTFTWNAGVWDAASAGPATTIGPGATLEIATGASHDLRRRAVTNEGTVNWISGYIRGGDGSTFTNASGGTFNDLNAGSYTVHNPYGSGTFTFTNHGAYIRNTAGTTSFDVPFDNHGTVSLQQGSIQYRYGGILSSTGSITAAAGTTIVSPTDTISRTGRPSVAQALSSSPAAPSPPKARSMSATSSRPAAPSPAPRPSAPAPLPGMPACGMPPPPVPPPPSARAPPSKSPPAPVTICAVAPSPTRAPSTGYPATSAGATAPPSPTPAAAPSTI